MTGMLERNARLLAAAALLAAMMLLDGVSSPAAAQANGSFSRSCRCTYNPRSVPLRDRYSLYCKCLRGDNMTYNWTEIRFKQCPNWSVANFNGTLRCGQ